MNGYISASLINKLTPKEKLYEVRDTSLKGFMLRVSPTGRMTYVVEYARGKKVRIGHVGVFKPQIARDKAAIILGDYANGLDPKQEAKAKRKYTPTLNDFIEETYEAWIKTHNVSGAEDIKTIYRHFKHLLNRPLDKICVADIESWRTKKLANNEMQANTINRTITPLRSVISKAVEWKVIESHGLAGLKILKCDDSRVRYFSDEERKCFFNTLNNREKTIKAQRANANQWRKERGYELYPEMRENEYADHMLPMIILALNTGIRKSEGLRLKRGNVNLIQGSIFIEKSKNYLSRYIPLNDTSIKMLKVWMKQTKHLNNPYLFPSPLNIDKPIVSIKKAWMKVLKDSKIEDFRWHDLRHDFASRLVMKGVSLYAVQRLMGHKSIEQTMKYAHLAPDFIAESVRKLD